PAITSLDDLTTLLLFTRETETSRYAVSWKQRWAQIRSSRDVSGLKDLLREGLGGFRELTKLTPEEKADIWAKTQKEAQDIQSSLEAAFTSGNPLILPASVPPFVWASDQPSGHKIPCRYAFPPVELMRALALPEPVNPLTRTPFPADVLTYMRNKFAVPMKLCA